MLTASHEQISSNQDSDGIIYPRDLGSSQEMINENSNYSSALSLC